MDVDKVAAAVSELLCALGVDEGEHTTDTPGRVARGWVELLAGHDVDPARHLTKTFPGQPDPSLVIVAGIPFVTTCAHHLLPITGTATVAYRPYPNGPIVGLSKLIRVFDDYAHRLQLQERLGWQVASTIAAHVDALGVGCVITAEHGCMSARGVNRVTTATTTTVWQGKWEPGHPDVLTVLAEHHRHGKGAD